MMMKEERKRFILSPKMLNIWAHEIQLSYLQKKNEKSDKRNFKEKKENKGYITWEDNVINSSSDSENKIISLGIMMKDYENGEEQSRYIDSNFSKHMACIKVYSYFFPR